MGTRAGLFGACLLALAGCGAADDRVDPDAGAPALDASGGDDGSASDDGGRDGASGSDDATTADAGTETQLVGPEGGVVVLGDGDVRLEIPPGALAEPIEITGRRVSDVPRDRQLLDGTAWDFGPDGTTFALPVRLTMRYAPESVSGTRTSPTFLRVHRLTDGAWVEVPGGMADPATSTVSGSLSGFSTYALRYSMTVPETRVHGSWTIDETLSPFGARRLDCTGFRCQADPPTYVYTPAECGGPPFTSGSYMYFDPEGWGVWDQGPITAAWLDYAGTPACFEATFWLRNHFVWIIENAFSADDFWVTIQGESSPECSGQCVPGGGAGYGLAGVGLGTGNTIGLHLRAASGASYDFLVDETGAPPGAAAAQATRCSMGASPCTGLGDPFGTVRRYP